MLAFSNIHIPRAATLVVLPCLLIAVVTTTKYLLTPGRFLETFVRELRPSERDLETIAHEPVFTASTLLALHLLFGGSVILVSPSRGLTAITTTRRKRLSSIYAGHAVLNFLFSISLVLFYNGMLHLPSLGTWLLLLPLTVVAREIIVECAHRSNWRTRVVKVLLPALGCVFALLMECKLDAVGLLVTVSGTVTMGVAMATQHLCFGGGDSEVMAGREILITTILPALSALCLGLREENVQHLSLTRFTSLALTLNVASVFLVVRQYKSMIMLTNNTNGGDIEALHSERAIQSASTVAATGLLIWFWSKSIAPWRDRQSISQAVLFCLICSCWADMSTGKLSKFRKSLGPSIGVLMIVTMVCSSILTTLPSSSQQIFRDDSLAIGLGNNVPTIPSVSRLDIVVSMYDEPHGEVNRFLRRLESLPALASLNPTIFVYTKKPILDSDRILENISSNISITELPNTGREAATYLHHIIERTSQSAVADHTLFSQAQIHNELGFFRHLEQHLIPFPDNATYPGYATTGFLSLGTDARGSYGHGPLSLGRTAVVSTCIGAHDRHGWQDHFGIMPYLSSALPTLADTECTTSSPVVLSYKGQFLVSRTRIEQVPAAVYQRLYEALTSSSGWGHEGALDHLSGTAAMTDTVDHPLFGYSMERAWSVLFACNDVHQVVYRCPTMLGAMISTHFLDRAFCQCMDWHWIDRDSLYNTTTHAVVKAPSQQLH